MNEMLKEQDSVFGGGESGGTDWKTKYEQLEREYASARVEQGRVKKLDEEKKALEKELEELRAKSGRESVLSALSDEERGNIAPEVLDATSKLLAQQKADFERQLAEVRAMNRGNAKEDFARRIEGAFPGFIASVGNGGPNSAAWQSFRASVGRYVDQAYANLDFDGVSYFIRRFYEEIGSEAPKAGSAGSTAPDPDAVAGGIGGTPSGGSKVFTHEEVSEMFDRIEECRRREDFREASRLEAEIDRAMSEGRVRD